VVLSDQHGQILDIGDDLAQALMRENLIHEAHEEHAG
jgi:hypothetical protein